MPPVTPWLVVLIYLVPIVGTLVSMKRRVGQLWSFGEGLRRFFPEDRVYRRIKVWEVRYNVWKERHPLASYANLDLFNLTAGKIEYGFGHLRDYTIGLTMMGAFAYDLTLMVVVDPALYAGRFPILFYHGFFALLSLWTYRRHVGVGLEMTEFMRVNPFAHPGEFFEHYYRRLGPAAVPVPAKASRAVDPGEVSYLTGRPPRRGLWPLIRGSYDTAIFARSAIKAMETIGPEYGREVFDAMSSLWGSRMLHLCRAQLTVEGLERFHILSGKIILVFNHKSNFDFVLNFFALSSTHLASGRRIRTRYMAAKDHLVDNKLIHSGLGVGKLIESVDMVFVDRKGKGKNAVLEAAQKLSEKEIEIAMYPQGTRALCNVGADGERLDAGYYTTGTASSLKAELGHLKKGSAYLLMDTAIALRDRGIPVHLVPIGIDGTANLMPKGSFKIQTEVTVRFTVGDILTIQPADVEGMAKGNPRYVAKIDLLQEEIDRRLVHALRLHEKLRNRFLGEVKKDRVTAKDNLLKINHSLTEADRRGDRLPFVILDRIYALPPREQSPHIRELARRLCLPGEELASLRDRVTDQLFRHRGREMRTVLRQEQAKKAS